MSIERSHTPKIRPAAHAGAAYAADPGELRQQLESLFCDADGPGLLPWEGLAATTDLPDSGDRRLLGMMAPHIDFARGGSSYGWAYDRLLSETDADLFVVLATAHRPLRTHFNVSDQDFATPLGEVACDRETLERLRSNYAGYIGAEQADLAFDDPRPHALEHSIELQTVLLQYALAPRRQFSILPILVDSFHRFVVDRSQPDLEAGVSDFVQALRETLVATGRRVCLVGSVDLAHIGPQFGDSGPLSDARLKQQWTADQQLLALVCSGDAPGWFEQIASDGDQNRVCGLAPMYVMLEAMGASRGELLKYEQAVAEDRSACVSFASVAFYGES